MEDDYIRIARITGVHGLNGRLKIMVVTDARERFETSKSIFIGTGGSYRKFTIVNYSDTAKGGLLQLEGINDRDSALAHKGLDIFIEKAEAEKTRETVLDEESYYHYDIIGCAVYCEGRLFGEVTDILQAGSGDILIISNNQGKTFMVPFVKSMVDTNGIRDRKLDIHPVEGLFDI